MPKTGPRTGDPIIYDAMRTVIENGLREDGSAFMPGEQVWTAENFGALRRHFIEQPDIGKEAYLEKLQGQLEGAPDKAIQLMGELHYVHLLIPVNILAPKKRQIIRAILDLMQKPVAIPESLIPALDHGFINPGTYYLTRRDLQISFLIEFGEAWKGQTRDAQDKLLKDPWAFKEFTSKLPVQSAYAQREALLHLIHTDTFERIVSHKHKELIADHFASAVSSKTDDVDRKLAEIRAMLTPEYGEDFNFYDKSIKSQWKGDTPVTSDAPGEGPSQGESTLGNLASSLFIEPHDFLDRVVTLLNHKRQVIFHGPPGTGKTFVARKLAEHLAGIEGSVELVQFHPSYSYEDFIQGYRPDDDGTGFVLRGGPLLQAARRAVEGPDGIHVLIIDEINRGNLAKVFGELYFLLEYRDEELTLQYSGDAFRLPKNLLVIGTMNTADRTIAIVDGALRRRFYFVPFFPNEPPVKGLLRRWLKLKKPSLEWVADAVDRANDLLKDRHAAIGPSHFIREDLNEEWVALIWEHAVLPYIAEQLFGEEERLPQFAIAALRHGPTGGVIGDEPAINSH